MFCRAARTTAGERRGMSEDGGGGVWHVRKWTPFGMCGEVLGKDMKSAADETHSLDSAGAPSAPAVVVHHPCESERDALHDHASGPRTMQERGRDNRTERTVLSIFLAAPSASAPPADVRGADLGHGNEQRHDDQIRRRVAHLSRRALTTRGGHPPPPPSPSLPY
jgi:hypothetical protein